VQVRIQLRPINPADVFGITGAHPSFKPASLPAVPGGEGAISRQVCGSVCLRIGHVAALLSSAVQITCPGSLQCSQCYKILASPAPSFSPPGYLDSIAVSAGMGTVAKIGNGVTAFKPGQRVVGMPWGTKAGDGSWQQYAVVSEGALVAVPDAVTDEAAAQYAVNPMTAYGLLDVSSDAAFADRRQDSHAIMYSCLCCFPSRSRSCRAIRIH